MGRNGQEVTTTFKVDISELKANIQEANRQIRLANSEFKKASSGMDDWGKSADGISAKITQLNTVIDSQESILDDLTKQYEKTAAEKGEDSKAAQELLIRINNLTSDINKNRNAVDSYTKKLSEMKEGTTGTMSASEALRAKISQQESELADLKEQYQDTVLEQGESSDAAQELKDRIGKLDAELAENRQSLAAAAYSSQDLAEGMEDTASASDRLKQTITRQESELADLKKKYTDVVLEQGKNSREAASLRKKISQLNSELDDNRKALDDAAESAEDLGGGFTVLKGALASLVADGLRKAGDALKDFLTGGDKAMNNFQARTGQGAEAMEKFKDEILDLYKQNFGESLEDVAESMATVAQQSKETDPSRIKELTQYAITLRDVFGYDINETMRASNMLMQQFGLSGEQAYNLIVQGAQNGLDKNGDLLDSINEYAVHYRQLGYDAEDFFNSMVNGAEAGTFSVDKLGDAMKEFGIRVKDTATTTDEAYKLLGLNAEKFRETFAKGGEDARRATQAVLEALFSMDDQVKQNQAGVDLFGTMWEDLGIDGVKALMDVSGGADKAKASMQEITDLQYADIASQWAEIGRTVKVDFLMPLSQQVIPVTKGFLGFLKKNLPVIVPLFTALGSAIAGAFVYKKVTQFAKAFKGLNLVMAANPAVLIAGAIAGLVAVLVMAYAKVDWFRDGVNSAFDAVRKVVGQAVKAVTRFLTEDLGKALSDPVKFLKDNWADIALLIANPFAFGFKMVYQHSETFRNFINNLLGSILSLLERFFPGLTQKFTGFVEVVRNAFTSGDWVSLGKYLVQGIANGIKAGAMLPVKAVQALAKNIWNGFKSMMGIHSPSKVMEGEGEQLPAGVAQGIRKNTKAAVKATKDMAKEIEGALTINKSKYEKMLDGLVTALKKRLEKQKDLRIRNIEEELAAEEEASDRRLRMYEDEYRAKVKSLDAQSSSEVAALQAQIDALEKAEEAREKAQEEAEYNSKVAALKEQILASESAEDRAGLEQELADTLADWQERKRKEQVQAEKDALQAQIEAIQEKADAEKEILQDQYDKRVAAEEERLEAVKASTDEEQAYWEEYYSDRLEDDQVNAEARRLVMEGNQDEIIDLLETYNPKWQDAGQSLADSLLNGLNSEKQGIQDAVSEALDLTDIIREQEKELDRLNKLAESQSGGGGGGKSGDFDWSTLSSEMDGLEFPTEEAQEFGDSMDEAGKKAEKSNGVFSKLGAAVKGFFVSTGSTVSTALASAGSGILTFFTVTVPGYWSTFLTTVSGWGAGILAILQQGWDGIVMFFTETIPAFIANVGGWFQQLPGMIYDMVVNILGHFVAWGIMLNDFVVTNVAGFVDDVVDWFSELPGKIHEWVTNAMEKVTDWGTDLITWATTKPSEFVDNVITFISELPGKLWEWFTQAMEKVTDWGTDLIKWATTKIPEFIGKIITKLAELPGKMWAKLQEAWQKVVDWGIDLMNAGIKAAKDLFDSIVDGVKGLPDELYNIGVNALEGFENGLKSVADRIKNWAEKFFQDILDKAEEVLDIASPSKAFKKIGRFVMQGFQIGMDDESKAALSNTKRIFSNIIDVGKDAASSAVGKISGTMAEAAQARDRQTSGPQKTEVVYNFYQTNNSPKALSRREVYRQSRNLLKGAALANV